MSFWDKILGKKKYGMEQAYSLLQRIEQVIPDASEQIVSVAAISAVHTAELLGADVTVLGDCETHSSTCSQNIASAKSNQTTLENSKEKEKQELMAKIAENNNAIKAGKQRVATLEAEKNTEIEKANKARKIFAFVASS
ncbi:hypothetical protein COX25_05460 [bacterium (Candidatus Howlettbacteria) CG23_combo_of_CG06-09_8_20_14_all_37_9]|nr:MAG: hypothetical protein COX25_05460 [bacterium (Candidatus Howlettbacteria) CG23_combo_of_CG06-09_8_20_14_all_37_9]